MLRSRRSPDKVLALFDYLDWGPIDCSRSDRVAWLDEHARYEEGWDWLVETVDEFRAAAAAAKDPLVWIAPRNANELSALFWFAHHVGIDGAQMMIADFPIAGGWRNEPPLSLGELPAELLAQVLDGPPQPWDDDRFPTDTWPRLVAEGALLRIAEGGRLRSAPADRFDDRLLRNCRADWTPAFRVIGETMGQASGDGVALNDSFLRWRLGELIGSGQLEAQGDLAIRGVANAAKVRRAG